MARHVERLYDDGFIDGSTFSDLAKPYKRIFARDLTSAGHDFFGALKSDDVWNQVKSALSPEQLGTLPLRKLAGIFGDLLEKYLRTKPGL